MSTFKNLVGQRINGIFLGNDNWTLVFRTIEGRYYRYDTSNDCCNSVWVNHMSGVNVVGDDNSFDLLRGALVLSAEDRGWNDNRSDEDGYDVIQDGFWCIVTDRGYIDIEVRNSHNGYYGGDLSEVDIDQYPLAEVEGLDRVYEDF
jgi:hypothetical protein